MDNAHSLVTLVKLRSQLRSGEARAIREAAGATYREAAMAAGVCPESLRRWERGEVQPQPSAGLRYARILKELAATLESTPAPVERVAVAS